VFFEFYCSMHSQFCGVHVSASVHACVRGACVRVRVHTRALNLQPGERGLTRSTRLPPAAHASPPPLPTPPPPSRPSRLRTSCARCWTGRARSPLSPGAGRNMQFAQNTCRVTHTHTRAHTHTHTHTHSNTLHSTHTHTAHTHTHTRTRTPPPRYQWLKLEDIRAGIYVEQCRLFFRRGRQARTCRRREHGPLAGPRRPMSPSAVAPSAPSLIALQPLPVPGRPGPSRSAQTLNPPGRPQS
jgi:hypothetical protein